MDQIGFLVYLNKMRRLQKPVRSPAKIGNIWQYPVLGLDACKIN